MQMFSASMKTIWQYEKRMLKSKSTKTDQQQENAESTNLNQPINMVDQPSWLACGQCKQNRTYLQGYAFILAGSSSINHNSETGRLQKLVLTLSDQWADAGFLRIF